MKVVDNFIIIFNYFLRVEEGLSLNYSDITTITFNIILSSNELNFINFKFFPYFLGLNTGGNNIIIEKAVKGLENCLKNGELNKIKYIFGSNTNFNYLIIKGFEGLNNVRIIFLVSRV